MAACMVGQGEFDRAKNLTAEAFAPKFRGISQNQIMELLRRCVALSSTNSSPIQKSRPESVWEDAGVMRKLLAAALAGQMKFPEAIEELTHVIRLRPYDVIAQIDRATYLAVVGRDEEAIAQLRTTAVAAPTNAIALSNLAALLAKRGQFQTAFPHYRAALAIDPNNPNTRHNFAIALARSGQALEAKREFETVLRHKPNHLPATQQLAWLLATNAPNRDLRRALQLAEVAVGQKRTAPSLDALAAVLAANRDFKGAVTVATEALDLARREHFLEDAIRARLEAYRNNQSAAD